MPDKIKSHPVDEPPSKSQIKRDMLALSELGAQLVDLPVATLQKLPLPEQLAMAIHECQAINKHGGRKRQLKFIGKIMRDVDADEIRLALEKVLAPQRADAQQFHLVEQWRDRLLDEGDPALAILLDDYPQADRQQLRQLLRNARNAKLSDDKRKQATRELFRSLRAFLAS
jgi:ribosome-associated protein